MSHTAKMKRNQHYVTDNRSYRFDNVDLNCAPAPAEKTKTLLAQSDSCGRQSLMILFEWSRGVPTNFWGLNEPRTAIAIYRKVSSNVQKAGMQMAWIVVIPYICLERRPSLVITYITKMTHRYPWIKELRDGGTERSRVKMVKDKMQGCGRNTKFKAYWGFCKVDVGAAPASGLSE
jgi:hypothetical protein